MTISAGSSNAYAYNGVQHGVQFKSGNSIAIDVEGSVQVDVGDCAYSNVTELTMTSANGWSQTETAKVGCSNSLSFTYSGGATTLYLNFTGSAYVPYISVTPIEDDPNATPTPTPTPGPVTYDFTDGSIIPTDTNGKSDVTSGNLTVLVGPSNAYSYNGVQHGVYFKAGNSIQIEVDGAVQVEVGDCSYSNVTELSMASANGWSQTVAANTGCGNVMIFNYDGEATTLSIDFVGGIYITHITVIPVTE